MLEVMRDILQSRYMRSKVAHKQLARTSLRDPRHWVAIYVYENLVLSTELIM